MKIQQTIELPLEVKGKEIICYDRMTFQMVMGTSAASGNLHIYQARKQGNKYIVPIETVKRRVSELRARIDKEMRYLQIMQQVIGE